MQKLQYQGGCHKCICKALLGMEVAVLRATVYDHTDLLGQYHFKTAAHTKEGLQVSDKVPCNIPKLLHF